MEKENDQLEHNSIKVNFKGLTNQAVMVTTDRSRFQQVLLNLLTNAVKYAPSNSSVSCIVNYARQLSKVTVSVKDRGIGLLPEQTQ